MATMVLVIVPVIALNAGGKSPADFHWFDRAAVGISAPIQTAIRWSIETVWDGLEHYILLVNTQEHYKEVILENRKLLNELATFQEVAKENLRLKSIVEFNAPLEGQKIVAQVIAQDLSPEYRMIRVNKGEAQGVKTGMAVIALEGIVGRVIRVGPEFSDVLTILDIKFAVDAIVQRNRIRGIVEGLGGSILTMKYLRRTDDVQEGDIVVSSGIGGIFPKGLSVGRVVKVEKKNFGINQNVGLVPAVDFQKLEEITLIDPPKIPLELATLEELKPQDKQDGRPRSKEKRTKNDQ